MLGLISSSTLAVLLATPPEPVESGGLNAPTGAESGSEAIAEPEAVVAGDSQPKPGGFGTVSGVTTESNVAVEAPPDPSEEAEEQGPRSEASGRVFGGYGRSDVGNAQAWDHGGAALGATLQWYPYLTPRRRFGVGVELGYAYQGLVRRKLPALADPQLESPFTKSQVQQHFVDFGLALLMRPHREWFSIQPTGALGFALYTDRDLYAADRHGHLVGRSSAFGLSGSLALCTAWDIVCVVGGYRWTRRIDAVAALDAEPFSVPTQGWYAGLGFDILRVYARLNAQPAAR